MSKQQIIYYKDELNDEFEGEGITPIKIDANYKYIHKNVLWNILSFILYRVIATPIAYIYMKFKFGLKIKNKSVLKTCKNRGYFVYANHTQEIADALNPTLINFPKKVYVVVHPNNVSIPFWGKIIKLLGPLPIPGDFQSSKNFIDAINIHISNKNVVMIYPEAHVWNYYTKIRPFEAHSFKYPVKSEAPTFSMTITYQKRKRKIPRMIVYLDGPFYPKKDLNYKEKQEDLRKQVYDCMSERVKESNIEYIKYVKVGENDD